MKSDAVAETPLAICRGDIVKAVYREPEVPDHVGNPLEEALPPVERTLKQPPTAVGGIV